MLEDLINKLKAMLGKSGDSDNSDDDEESEKTGVLSKQQLQESGDQAEEGDEDDEDDEDDEVAKKKTMIIRGIVASVIIWFCVDEFILTKDVPPEAPKKSRKKKLKRKSPKKKAKVKEEKFEAIAESTAEARPETTPEMTPEARPETTPEMTPETTPEMTNRPSIEPTVNIIPIATPLDESNSDDSILSDLDQSIPDNNVSRPNGLGAFEDALNKLKPESSKVSVSIPAAPDYFIIGRGLVYNCTGKHWACVDKKSYFICLKNYKASKENGVRPECSVEAIYGSDDDCQVIQTYNINTSKPTNFCSK